MKAIYHFNGRLGYCEIYIQNKDPKTVMAHPRSLAPAVLFAFLKAVKFVNITGPRSYVFTHATSVCAKITNVSLAEPAGA